MDRKKVTETDSFKYRVNLGHEGLNMLKKEYQILDWFNTLNHVERGCWWDKDYDALESFLNFIRERYNKDINSVDELFETKESNPDLPEDVKLYFDYKRETGRGIEDFYKLQKNYDDMDEDSVLADYLGVQEEGLDAIDIQDIMDDKFGYDSEEDDEKDIKKKKLAKKRELAKARKFFKTFI